MPAAEDNTAPPSEQHIVITSKETKDVLMQVRAAVLAKMLPMAAAPLPNFTATASVRAHLAAAAAPAQEIADPISAAGC